MPLRALASKIRILAALRRSSASRPIDPQGMAVRLSTGTSKTAEGGKQSLDEMRFEEQFRAYEKRIRRDKRLGDIIGTIIGFPAGVYVFYLMARID
uniref:Uncharacterized protein n=1 Tax=Leersia perrieri TaxID=77586 RepID=A0A0D9WVF2_9ORYZ